MLKLNILKMPFRFLVLFFGVLFLTPHAALCESFTYECRKDNKHVIHIVTLNPQKYSASLVKAHNQVIGRETLETIAKRAGADIAINAGFFEIGNSEDGMPSGTLIINDHIFGLSLYKHACLIEEGNAFKIEEVKPRLTVTIGNKVISPTKVNQRAGAKDITLYTPSWGSHTLSSVKDHLEIAISPDQKILTVAKQGNLSIPQNGYVLSLPVHYPLKKIRKGDEAIVQLDPFLSKATQKISAVRGIPILLQDAKINPDLDQKKSTYYKSPHARTAFGIRSNGEVVLVVVEHHYTKKVKEVTLDEVKDIISNNKLTIMATYKKTALENLTLAEMKEIVAKEFVHKDPVVGLTMIELATLMKELACISAINLDGGGSSSLYLNNQIINHIVGDKDEALGQSIQRPLADAIVFKRLGQ